MMVVGGKTVNCYNVCWMLATTDEGTLFDAFRTRFSPVNLTYLTKAEIAKIIGLANPDFDEEVCKLVARYNGRIPRKALEFARYMKMVRNMNPSRSWADVAAEVASDEGIDEFGMPKQHLMILKALGQAPIAKNRLMNVVGVKNEELERFIMPQLLTATEDMPAVVVVTNKGYTITAAGLAELDKRGIKHNGVKALPKAA
jgi:Holliday junction resolvasome RuvABC ATP-dependent DNA helicase subunit